MSLPIENRTQIRILKLLADNPNGLNITSLMSRLSTTHSLLTRNLADLKQKGFVKEQNYGKIRIFKLNIENPKTNLLKQLFKEKSKPIMHHRMPDAKLVPER